MSATLEIKRKSSLWAAARGARLLVDEREVAYIANGRTASVEVSPGTHSVAVKLGMTAGRPSSVHFEEGKTVRLNCRLKMGLSTTEFVLSYEDGAPLPGDAGPAGHHGTLILVFGILGFLIGLLGLAALIQGIVDLRKMSRGEMDPSGKMLTIVGTILGAVGFFVNLAFLILAFMLHVIGN